MAGTLVTTRVFIALSVPEQVKVTVSDKLRAIGSAIDQVIPPENWHLTIAWLGETTTIEQHVQRLSVNLPQTFLPTVRLTHLGRGRVKNQLWAYAENSMVLQNIHNEIVARVVALGLPLPDATRERPFIPHIRVADLVVPSIREVGVPDYPLTTSFSFFSLSVYLSRHNLTGGSQYKTIAQIPLTTTS